MKSGLDNIEPLIVHLIMEFARRKISSVELGQAVEAVYRLSFPQRSLSDDEIVKHYSVILQKNAEAMRKIRLRSDIFFGIKFVGSAIVATWLLIRLLG